MRKTIFICTILWLLTFVVVLLILKPWHNPNEIQNTIQVIATISICYVTLAYAICTGMLVKAESENRKQQKTKWDIEFAEKRIRGFFVPFIADLSLFIKKFVEFWDKVTRDPGERGNKADYTSEIWAGIEHIGKFLNENGYLLSAGTEKKISDLRITTLWRTIEGNRDEDWEVIIKESRELLKLLEKEQEGQKNLIREFYSYI